MAIDITIKFKETATLTDTQVLAMFVKQRGWTNQNPLTRQQYAKRWIADLIKQDIRDARRQEAVDAIVVPDEDTAE